MHIDKIKIKDKFLSFILLIVSVFCSQTLCYYYFDEFIRFYTSSLVTFIMLRIIFALFIFVFFKIFIKQRFERTYQIILLLAYFALILTLTLKPVPIQSYNFEPFKFITDIQIYKNQIYLFIGNLFLYIPIGLFLGVSMKRIKKQIIFILFLIVIFFIEVLQLYLKLGVFDIDDILLNYSGFLLGYFISLLYISVRQKFSKKTR